ncbi:hypothetical protein [Burkholderia stabilis]
MASMESSDPSGSICSFFSLFVGTVVRFRRRSFTDRGAQQQGHMLPSEGASGPGYMFFAPPEQKANTEMYGKYYPGGVGMNVPSGQSIANSAERDKGLQSAYEKFTLGAAAGAAGIVIGGPIAALPGAPIFSTGGMLGSGALASPVGTGVISAGINAGSQYLQNGKINPVDVVGRLAQA